MKNFASRIALLAVVGSFGIATAPAWAQNGPRVDCRNPANAQNAVCLAHKGGHGGPGGMHHGNGAAPQVTPPPQPAVKPPTNNAPGAFFNNSGKANPATPPRRLPPIVDDNQDNNRNFGNRDNNNNDYNDNGPGRRHGDHGGDHGFGHMSPGQMGHFRDSFRRFHFSQFPRPDFAIRLGVVVPRYFHLRPVPPEIFRDYPYYRGYLFFITPNGDIVIVSPRSYRIVDVI